MWVLFIYVNYLIRLSFCGSGCQGAYFDLPAYQSTSRFIVNPVIKQYQGLNKNDIVFYAIAPYVMISLDLPFILEPRLSIFIVWWDLPFILDMKV